MACWDRARFPGAPAGRINDLASFSQSQTRDCSELLTIKKKLGVPSVNSGAEAAIVPKMSHDGPYGLSPDDRMTRKAEAMVEQCRQIQRAKRGRNHRVANIFLSSEAGNFCYSGRKRAGVGSVAADTNEGNCHVHTLQIRTEHSQPR
jgi:hypothetical protein